MSSSRSSSPSSSKSLSIHFIGIGGCGMNGVAQLAAHSGHRVSGSDRETELDVFNELKKIGIQILPQDGSGISENTDVVVYSTAIEGDNPDLQKSNELSIPILHRAEMLAQLCEGKDIIAIAGTAGKSTVTGLLGYIFQSLGKDPSVYCGAKINNLNSSIRYGAGPWIIEADESDKSFLHFYPKHAIITNIAEDHFSLKELIPLFTQFEAQVSGLVIKQSESFCAPSKLLGQHNIENINSALSLCKALGFNMQSCKDAVADFTGIERRMERVSDDVIDDFAHSPIKVSAAMDVASNEFKTFNAVWRPHGFTPLYQGLDGFINCFRSGSACRIFILPVYYAGGTVTKKITAKQFVKRLQDENISAEFVENFNLLEKRLLEENLPVLIMGARDPELPKFARRLASQLTK